MKLALRIIIGGLIAVAIGIAIVPLLIILDIRDGGTGWGLCDAGLDTCTTSYFSGFEFVAFLLVALFIVLGLIGGCARLLRWVEKRDAIRERSPLS